MAYCVQSDLEIALGGADVLRELADFNHDGVADASVVTDYLESGASLINAALQVKHDMAAVTSPYERSLINANAMLSARIAFQKGARGQAMPENIASAAAGADDWLDKLARGERTLGATPQRSLNQPVGIVDYDPNGDGVSLAGFRRGFR